MLLEVPPGVVLFPVAEGQVLTAAWAPRQAMPAATDPHPTPGQAMGHALPLDPPAFAPPGEPSAHPTGTSASPVAGAGLLRGTNVEERVFVDTLFLVLTPEYLPEHILLRLEFPQAVEDATRAVAAARHPVEAAPFPVLHVMDYQPVEGLAILLAGPSWDPAGVLICIDCTKVDGRIFSLDVPARLTFNDILRLALLPSDAEVDVYVTLQQGPLDPEQYVSFQTGHLVQIVPRRLPVFAVTTLADMLQDPASWNPRVAVPGNFQDHVWVLSEHGHFRFLVRRGRRHAIRDDLANRLGVASSTLTACACSVPRTRESRTSGLLHQSCAGRDCRRGGWSAFAAKGPPLYLGQTSVAPWL